MRPFFSQKTSWILTTLMLSTGMVHADWDVEEIFLEKDASELKVLKTERYLGLKSSVLRYLQNSWCSSEKTNLIMDLILLTRPNTCVEIGTFTGSSLLPAASVLQYLQRGKIIAIDAWSNALAIEHLANNDPNKAWWASVDMKEAHKIFLNMMRSWAIQNYCTVIKDSSNNAANQIGSIDFLHLDGNYSTIVTVQEVKTYLPKVNPGGYVLLSNVFVSANEKLPKMEAFYLLYDQCDLVCEIDKGNSVLFRKN
jgi:predicted O-methyltransferase YrrM